MRLLELVLYINLLQVAQRNTQGPNQTNSNVCKDLHILQFPMNAKDYARTSLMVPGTEVAPFPYLLYECGFVLPAQFFPFLCKMLLHVCRPFTPRLWICCMLPISKWYLLLPSIMVRRICGALVSKT